MKTKWIEPRGGYSKGRAGNPGPPVTFYTEKQIDFSRMSTDQLTRLAAFLTDENIEMAGTLPPWQPEEGAEDFSARALENLTTAQLEKFLAGITAAHADEGAEWEATVRKTAEHIIEKRVSEAQTVRANRKSAADTKALAEAIRGLRASKAVEKQMVRDADGRMTHTVERCADGSMVVEEVVRDADDKRMVGMRAVTYTPEGRLATRARG